MELSSSNLLVQMMERFATYKYIKGFSLKQIFEQRGTNSSVKEHIEK